MAMIACNPEPLSDLTDAFDDAENLHADQRAATLLASSSSTLTTRH